MKYGFVIPGSSDFRALAELASTAEMAGWDGIFIPDCIYIGQEPERRNLGFDAWLLLTAMAMLTKRIRLGTMLTPPSRRRPWKLARETVTLDHLSNGRLILSVGLGALDDGGFGKVGEPTDRKVRAEMLDESLAIILGLWSGQPFSFSGTHYQVDEMTFLPVPVQQPRIPIWVAGMWPRPKSMRRVLHYDGLLPNQQPLEGIYSPITPNDIAMMKAYIDANRTADTPFDVIMEGDTSTKSANEASETVAAYAEAGATWWLEAHWSAEHRHDIGYLREQIQHGPPHIGF